MGNEISSKDKMKDFKKGLSIKQKIGRVAATAMLASTPLTMAGCMNENENSTENSVPIETLVENNGTSTLEQLGISEDTYNHLLQLKEQGGNADSSEIEQFVLNASKEKIENQLGISGVTYDVTTQEGKADYVRIFVGDKNFDGSDTLLVDVSNEENGLKSLVTDIANFQVTAPLAKDKQGMLDKLEAFLMGNLSLTKDFKYGTKNEVMFKPYQPDLDMVKSTEDDGKNIDVVMVDDER